MPPEFEDLPDNDPEVEDDNNNGPYAEDGSVPIIVAGNKKDVGTQSIRNSFSIRNFRSEINHNDLLSSHSYLVTLSPFSSDAARGLNQFMNNSRDTLVMRCESAILPGVNLMTMNDVRRYGYGPVENMPHGVLFNDVTLTYIVDKRAMITKFYNDWVNLIVKHNSSYGGMKMETGEEMDPYEVGYKDDYSNYKLSVWVYDRQMNTALEYEVYDVFPKNIMDTPVQWGEQDNYIRLQILMAYTDMNVRNAQVTDFLGLEKQIRPGFDSFLPSFLNQATSILF